MSGARMMAQRAMIAALQGHAGVSGAISGVFDGPPARVHYPYISITESALSDWSTKTETGRELRMGITIWDKGDRPARLHKIMADAEDAIGGMAMGTVSEGWRLIGLYYLRSRVVRDADGPWAGMMDYRVRAVRV